MVYCAKCGQQNADGAQFCSNCAAPIGADRRGREKECERDCEDECHGGPPRGGSIIWGVIIALIGLFIVIELGLKNVEGMPDWIANFQLWWIIPVLIGIAIIVAGIRMMVKKA
ncbi:MAG: zinc-ribbon domain-containing protein [Candidatus Thermoplasmatota archaeon]|nr:zinc-ribbon domain-containing protein [Candidatus Thermoplasmatota archaeon]